MCSEKYHKAMKNKALWYFLEIYLLTVHFFYRNQFTVFAPENILHSISSLSFPRARNSKTLIFV